MPVYRLPSVHSMMYRNQVLLFIVWLWRPAQGLADALDGFLQPGPGRHVQPEIAGNGVDFGGIERDTAAVDGVDQLAGAGVVVQHDWLAGKTGLEASK